LEAVAVPDDCKKFLALAALRQGLARIHDNCHEDVKADIKVHVYIYSEIRRK